MRLIEFNELDITEAKDKLFLCCGSSKWVELMLEKFPFSSLEFLLDTAEKSWFSECGKDDYLEAFSHHPMIGDLEGIRKKYSSTQELTSSEQAGVNHASSETLEQLVSYNKKYLARFGFIFLVCATGKTAEEMLRFCKIRYLHNAEDEILLAAGEQHKISLIRLSKLIPDIKKVMGKSQITTHVLDTSKGIPGIGIAVSLQRKTKDRWEEIAVGITDNDGRISDLLSPGIKQEAGVYQIIFRTGSYFGGTKEDTFFPEVNIQFYLGQDEHYHVPLLISPFSYSTYRGS